MNTFKGYDSESLMNAVSFASRNYKDKNTAVSAVAKYLSKENAYEVHKKLCLSHALRENGIILNETEARVVMECFATNDYTRENILFVKEAYKRLSMSHKENDIDEYRKIYLEYKEHLRAQRGGAPVDSVLDELIGIQSYANGKSSDDDIGVARTLDKIRAGKVRYAQMAMDELSCDIKFFKANCQKVVDSAEIEDVAQVYTMLNDTLNELSAYEELLDEELITGTQKLESKAVAGLVEALTVVNADFRKLLCGSAIEEETNIEDEVSNENATKLQDLIEKFNRQWHTYLVHYQDILVYHNSDYVVRNNPYAKRLMIALEATDKKLKSLTGKSYLQTKLLEVEDRYRPILTHGKKKTLRTAESGEDE